MWSFFWSFCGQRVSAIGPRSETQNQLPSRTCRCKPVPRHQGAIIGLDFACANHVVMTLKCQRDVARAPTLRADSSNHGPQSLKAAGCSTSRTIERVELRAVQSHKALTASSHSCTSVQRANAGSCGRRGNMARCVTAHTARAVRRGTRGAALGDAHRDRLHGGRVRRGRGLPRGFCEDAAPD